MAASRQTTYKGTEIINDAIIPYREIQARFESFRVPFSIASSPPVIAVKPIIGDKNTKWSV